MSTVELLEHSLEQVVARIGDPAPQVYERLFAQSPELRAMFVGDPLGMARTMRLFAPRREDRLQR